MWRYALCFYIIATIASCKCREAQDAIVLDEEMRHYIFNTGSYWVYKEQSGLTDTIIVKHGSGGMLRVNDYNLKCADYEELYYQECIKSDAKGIYVYEISRKGIRLSTGNLPPPKYGDVVFNRSTAPETNEVDQTLYWAYYDSLVIQGKVFYKVKEYFMRYTGANKPDTNYWYWCPDYGLVRKEAIDSLGVMHRWELIDWKVIK